jgi:nucleotide-binding universal stress UspA family protein
LICINVNANRKNDTDLRWRTVCWRQLFEKFKPTRPKEHAMKIVLAADGSKYTKKALAFLVTHESMAGPADELFVLNVQGVMPARVKRMLGAAEVLAYQREEAAKVLDPIKKFLDRHALKYRSGWVTGNAAEEIVLATRREGAHMLVMGTHGHGLLGRALMGSIAQRVIADCDIPVLLVK